MAVGVDQPRCEQAAGQFAHLLCIQAQRLFARGNQGDAAVTDAQGVLFEYHAGRFDRNQPGRQQEQIERGLEVGHRGCPRQSKVAEVYPSACLPGSL